MRVTTKIGIDLQRPSYPTVINAVQGDQNTRQLEISLYSGSVAWQIPENTVVAMRYCKPDRTKGYYDTMPDGSTAFTVSENMVSILLAPQILTVAGTVSAQVVLYQGTAVLSTFSVQIRVEADPSAGAVTSEDYVNWMQWIKSELDAYLEQLKTNGEFVGGTAVGDIDMNGHALSGLREPVRDDEAATKGYVDEIIQSGTGAVSTVAGVSPDADGNVPLTAADVKALPIDGGTMEGPVNMSGQKLSGLNAPTADDEAATKGYVDTNKVDKANVVNNFTTTEEGFVADARALKVLNDSKLSMELLWENASPESSFPPQSIAVDLSEGDLVAISFKSFCVLAFKKGVNRVGFVNMYGPAIHAININCRTFDICDNSIRFEDGYVFLYQNQTIELNNEAAIPTEIYVIKGASA